jgi:glutathione S-transferase
VELQDETERTRYRKMYPLGQLPVIVLNHGPMIPESSIIIEYMDGLGGPRMISEYGDLARKIRFKDRFMDLYLIDSIKLLREERRKPEPDRDATRLALARHRAGCVYDFLEHELAGQTWANGEEFSMADCTAAAALAFACDEVSYADYPALSAYAERLGKRPSVQQVRQEAARYSKTASATR